MSIISRLCLHQLTIQKRTAVVIMADVRYKTKDKSNILKKLSKKFNTISMKKSFHRIQVDIIPDRFMVRRESNSIVSAKETTSNVLTYLDPEEKLCITIVFSIYYYDKYLFFRKLTVQKKIAVFSLEKMVPSITINLQCSVTNFYISKSLAKK